MYYRTPQKTIIYHSISNESMIKTSGTLANATAVSFLITLAQETIISVPVQTAAWPSRKVGTLLVAGVRVAHLIEVRGLAYGRC